jgi:hypothetical protein
MTARRTHPVDEAMLLDLLLKGDYAGFAKLTGYTVDQIERMLEGRDDQYGALDDEGDDCFFDEEEDGEDEDAFAWRRRPSRTGDDRGRPTGA